MHQWSSTPSPIQAHGGSPPSIYWLLNPRRASPGARLSHPDRCVTLARSTSQPPSGTQPRCSPPIPGSNGPGHRSAVRSSRTVLPHRQVRSRQLGVHAQSVETVINAAEGERTTEDHRSRRMVSGQHQGQPPSVQAPQQGRSSDGASKVLPIGTERSILKQTGMNRRPE